jgi:hypothetical protein
MAENTNVTQDTITPWASIAVVLAGLVVLLYGVSQHNYDIQLAGGVVGLLGFGLLTTYIAKL